MKVTTSASIQSLLSVLLGTFLVAGVPLFFLPVTEEIYTTSKVYVVFVCALILVVAATIRLVMTGKVRWTRYPIDNPLLFFGLTTAVALIVSSVNKVQAIVNPLLGPIAVLPLITLYFFLTRANSSSRRMSLLDTLGGGVMILSLLAIVFFFQPLANVNLPGGLAFLQNPYFTPIGSYIDLAIFLGFFVSLHLTRLIGTVRKYNNGSSVLHDSQRIEIFIFQPFHLIITLVAFVLTVYNVFYPVEGQNPFVMAPFNVSWYAALEVLKNPFYLFFGVGVDNFSVLFTKAKMLSYNMTDMWEIASFPVSRSALLHIFSELGVFGLIAFGMVLWNMAKYSRGYGFQVLYLIVIFTLFPLSYPLLFLFTVMAAFITCQTIDYESDHRHSNIADRPTYVLNVRSLLPLYVALIIVLVFFIGTSAYLGARAYGAELYHKQAKDAVRGFDVARGYANYVQAITMNPYIEHYRIGFSRLNMDYALALLQTKSAEAEQMTQKEKQAVKDGIRAAIAEAQAAKTLNPRKAGNWANLSRLNSNLISLVEGADVWTIVAYQEAIALDPQNPVYWLQLGGVHYSLGQYASALSYFDKATILKSDWASAHYSKAWAMYHIGNIAEAIEHLQKTLSLLDPIKEEQDFIVVEDDLKALREEFANDQYGSEHEDGVSSDSDFGSPQLLLPTPIEATKEPNFIIPEIDLESEQGAETEDVE